MVSNTSVKAQFKGNEWDQVKNVLVMRLDNIGDVVMTGPALRAIKENLPRVQLTLMASPAGAQAAPLLPWVDEVLVWRALWQQLGEIPWTPEREWELVELLRERRFDAAIILTSFSQCPHPPGFVAYLAGIPIRIGESKEQGNGELTFALASAPDSLHQAERNLRLLERAGFQVTDRDLSIRVPAEAQAGAVALLARRGISPGTPYLLWNPWASAQARTYFPERFANAARLLAEKTGWPVVVTGAEKDHERTRPLLQILGPHAVDLLGVTSVPEWAAVIGNARLALTNNTGVLHLAEATCTPVIVLYSGTDLESQWRPRRAPYRLLRRPTACSPCYAFTCPFNRECMDFTPDEVVQAALELLED